MKLQLIGHNYKYAAEQMLLSLFPAERPVYPEGDLGGDGARLTLADGQACRPARRCVPLYGTARLTRAGRR